MNAFKFKQNAKTGKSGGPVHQDKVKGLQGVCGLSPCSEGLGAFYSAGPVLRLGSVIQTKGAGNAPNDRHQQQAELHAEYCPGRPFARSTREFFEPRFGRDFSQVRVHTCGPAVQMSRELKAQAFTYGNNIYFNQGKYNPGTPAGKQLLAHELTHVVQQKSGPMRIQRVQDEVIGCNRDEAQACLAHLHGNETTALETAKKLYCDYCVNLVHLTNYGCRLLRVEVTHNNNTYTCCADPNRIFDDSQISSNWQSWNNIGTSQGNWGCSSTCRKNKACLSNPIKDLAQQAVIDFRNNSLLPAIQDCRGRSVQGNAFSQGLPIAVFHNNTPRGGFSILYYKGPDGIEFKKGNTALYNGSNTTTADKKQLEEAFSILKGTNPNLLAGVADASQLVNPHIESGVTEDNFVLVTEGRDFAAFVQKGRNVVLQAANPYQDGSLSVYLKDRRYVNIEAEPAAKKDQEDMGVEALEYAFKIPPGRCLSPLECTHPDCPTC